MRIKLAHVHVIHERRHAFANDPILLPTVRAEYKLTLLILGAIVRDNLCYCAAMTDVPRLFNATYSAIPLRMTYRTHMAL
jgi:hypothetical protein